MQDADYQDIFLKRHLGSSQADEQKMLAALQCDSIAALIDQVIPANIRCRADLQLPPACSEAQVQAQLHTLAEQNSPLRSLIGAGYAPSVLPPVLRRNMLENPAWYTAYTPYQAEISQGRLEMLMNFQQLTVELTGMAVANASLLDEASAAAEAMQLALRVYKGASRSFWVSDQVHPQTLDVLRTRAAGLGIELCTGALDDFHGDCIGGLVQYPGSYGDIPNLREWAQRIHGQVQPGLLAVAADPLALVLLEAPATQGADIVLGSMQRFGLPMGLGGPHAAFFAVSQPLVRQMPGRVIGFTQDAHGKPALRMALQTREQHIRREKATSNICTSQALLACLSAGYALYHGPDGLAQIATSVHRLTVQLAACLQLHGLTPQNRYWFDTLTFDVGARQTLIARRAAERGYQLRLIGRDKLGVSLNETCTCADIAPLVEAFSGEPFAWPDDAVPASALPVECVRQQIVPAHPVFSRYQSETRMMRYLKRLENRDYSLIHGMIPLGSCTMKLNPAVTLEALSWPAFADVHPFAPPEQWQGYQHLAQQLCTMLAGITGFSAVSLQPNSGAQGEYAGLLAIMRYHRSRSDYQRNLCLIPASAHGTNPASAHMLGLEVCTLRCDQQGNIDLAQLDAVLEERGDQVAALMLTYPSTHGVFEPLVRRVCQRLHAAGGQVYMDGANMNAQLGLTQPALIGADVCHLNLHKTFAIPHGGGGPGAGPIAVAHHLKAFLPGHHAGQPVAEPGYAVSAAPMGSGLILTISWAFIRLLGAQGLKACGQRAILQANYLAARLEQDYSILYRGEHGRVAHECILDLRPFKKQVGITEEDIAKRLMDYGFHAPTVSFPVDGTLMIEPTESEDLAELDRFVAALQAIRREIRALVAGAWPKDNNPLVNAPHVQAELACDEWPYPYSRQQACYPAQNQADNKFWPSVKRLDQAGGDRHLQARYPIEN